MGPGASSSQPSDTPDSEGGAPLQRELDAQRDAFDRELMRKSFRIADLEQRIEEIVRSYEMSLSWRVTAPLRIAKRVLRRR